MLRVERELRAAGDVSDPTWESVIQQLDALSKEDLRRILDLLATS